MPTAKSKSRPAKGSAAWKRMHKIKVHDNRWLVWAGSAAVFACVLLLGYISITDVHFESQMFGGQNYGPNWMTFTHRGDGYTLKYPKSWAVEAAEPNTISFVDTEDVNEYFSVTIYDSADEAEVRDSLFSQQEAEVTVAGRDGIMISQDRTQAESVVMVEEGDDLYVFRGRGGMFERVMESFRWTQKIE